MHNPTPQFGRCDEVTCRFRSNFVNDLSIRPGCSEEKVLTLLGERKILTNTTYEKLFRKKSIGGGV